MAGQFMSPEGDLEQIFVDDFAMIDQYAATGSLWMWGQGSAGRLGDNTVANKSSPVQTISAGTNWKHIALSGYNSAAIKTDGTLWVWGDNNHGILGVNDLTPRSSPVQTVAGGTNWKQVSACSWGFHFAAIKTDGTLWSWGFNADGALGDNTVNKKSSPVQTIAGGNNWKQVSAGDYHTAAIKTDGTLWLWGQNSNGNLGDNTVIRKSSPVQTISGGTNWKQVSCGGYHTTAIKTDGTLWVWGANWSGRLGDGSVTSRSSPVQIAGGGNTWKQVAAADSNTLAIKTDGTLWGWGPNGGGVPIGDYEIRSTPVQTIAGGTNWKLVACGNYHGAGIKTDGTLWLWGYNNVGQLGDNTITDRLSIIQTVAGGNNWKHVACGLAHTAAIHFYDAGNLYPSA